MMQNRRYEPVATNEETPPPQPVTLTLDTTERSNDEPCLPPPPYSALYMLPPAADANEPPEPPPAYNVAAMKLPSYEESTGPKHDITQTRITLDNGAELELGSDCVFAACFLMSFVFNAIGFLAGYCLTRSIAGRYGSIAGFGLSLVKWTLIIKNTKSSDANHLFGAAWVWWVCVALGWLLFIRGVVVYLHVKLLVKRGRGLAPQMWGIPSSNTLTN